VRRSRVRQICRSYHYLSGHRNVPDDGDYPLRVYQSSGEQAFRRVFLGQRRHAARDVAQLGRIVDKLEVAGTAGSGEYVADGRLAQRRFGMAGTGIHDNVKGRVRTWFDK